MYVFTNPHAFEMHGFTKAGIIDWVPGHGNSPRLLPLRPTAIHERIQRWSELALPYLVPADVQPATWATGTTNRDWPANLRHWATRFSLPSTLIAFAFARCEIHRQIDSVHSEHCSDLTQGRVLTQLSVRLVNDCWMWLLVTDFCKCTLR